MAGFFKKITRKIFDKPDAYYLEQPRRIPESCKADVDADNGKVILSMEFVDPEDIHVRHYRLARKEDGNSSSDMWSIKKVIVDLKKDTVSEYLTSIADNSREAVEILSGFDAECLADKKSWKRIDHSRPTYRKLANQLGLHFDVNANIIDFRDNVVADTYLSSKAVKQVFKATSTRANLSSWEKLYENIVCQSPVKTDDVTDIAADPAWPEFVKSADVVVKKLNDLPETLLSKKLAASEKARGLENMTEYVIINPLAFNNAAKAEYVLHVYSATVLIGLLRAASQIYDSQFADGGGISQEKIKIVSQIGDTAAQLAQKHFGFDEASSKKLADIIAQGKDPYGPDYPLTKIIAAAQKNNAPEQDISGPSA